MPSLRAVSALLALTLAACSRPSPTGVAADRAIREPSGVTYSPTHEGVFWVHGDSGTGNWLFAVDREGELLARLRVKGAGNVDWEDITHDDRGNLWLGDIGNNDSSRRDLAVYRIPEPTPREGVEEVRADLRVPFSYPEQRSFGDKFANFDAEALFWWAGELWLLTKHRSDDYTRLYRFPALTGEAVELEQAARFDLGASLEGERKKWSGQVTAAELAPDGERWALLSYDALFVFAVPDPVLGGAEAGADLFAEPLARVAFDQDKTRQVEALTWDGTSLLLLNEDRHVFRIADPLGVTRYP